MGATVFGNLGWSFRALRRIASVALIALWASGLPAQAVVINVNGTNYDVLFYSNAFGTPHPSFNDNQPVLTNTATAPWWGNQDLARDFANAYGAQAPAGSFNVSSNTDSLIFAFAIPTNVSVVSRYRVDETTGFNFEGFTDRGSNFTTQVFAYVAPAPTPVPEIDGNALPKALFLLFSLWLWLDLRRRRRSA
jgi:hypothetical protein